MKLLNNSSFIILIFVILIFWNIDRSIFRNLYPRRRSNIWRRSSPRRGLSSRRHSGNPKILDYPKAFEYPNTFGYPYTFGYSTEKNWNYPTRHDPKKCSTRTPLLIMKKVLNPIQSSIFFLKYNAWKIRKMSIFVLYSWYSHDLITESSSPCMCLGRVRLIYSRSPICRGNSEVKRLAHLEKKLFRPLQKKSSPMFCMLSWKFFRQNYQLHANKLTTVNNILGYLYYLFFTSANPSHVFLFYKLP